MYDTIIVGGGPAGLTSAIYLLRARRKILVIEKETFGGQITKAFKVENYPGVFNISGYELGELMFQQATSLGMESMYGEVTKITQEKKHFLVSVGSEVLKAKSIIYAAGAKPRKLNILNEEKFIGSGVSYCATCDGGFFKDKTVCVIGGGNTAILDAIYLSNICKKVYVIHRSDILRAEPIKVSSLKERKNVEFIYHANAKEILGESKVEGVVLSTLDGERKIDVDGIFIAIGSVPNTNILNDLVAMNSNGYIPTNYQLEVAIPGFYVAGDVREKQIRQLTTATSDGTIAAIEVGNYLDTFFE